MQKAIFLPIAGNVHKFLRRRLDDLFLFLGKNSKLSLLLSFTLLDFFAFDILTRLIAIQPANGVQTFKVIVSSNGLSAYQHDLAPIATTIINPIINSCC